MNNKLSVIIMAAGKGTRMKSEIPKVLHELSGDTLLNHVIKSSEELSPDKIIIIIGYQAELVKKTISSDNILYSMQENQYGTGHAVMQAKPHLKNFKGNTLILSGDVPLIKASTLSSLINKHELGNYDACIVTAEIKNPEGYGRVIRDINGNLKKVQEHKDCNHEQLNINEINSGIYIFDNQRLFELLPMLDNNNQQSEYYLPDVLSMMVKDGRKIGLEKIKNNDEIQGVNTLEQLSYLENIYEKNN
tara:strand:+ start:1502 stop:2242 length:741 start_codon:yes stop_codon:yes gene_type:complete